MNKLSQPVAKFLKQTLWRYGTDQQRQLWLDRLENAPRYMPDLTLNPCPAPVPWPDDGLGDISDELRIALASSLEQESSNLFELVDSNNEDEVADAWNDYAYVSGLIKWIEA